jgi:Methyltransferase domain
MPSVSKRRPSNRISPADRLYWAVYSSIVKARPRGLIVAVIDRASLAAIEELAEVGSRLAAVQEDLAKQALAKEALGSLKPLWTEATNLVAPVLSQSREQEAATAARLKEYLAYNRAYQADKLEYEGTLRSAHLHAAPMKMTERAPALRDLINSKRLNVVEIGSDLDITLPKLLDRRIRSYLSVDIDENPTVNQAWQQLLKKVGVSTENKFRIAGVSTSLPVRSASQDLVFSSWTPPFAFHDTEASALHERSVFEVQRVLKPGGMFMTAPTTEESQYYGNPIMSKYFSRGYLHIPSNKDLSSIKLVHDRLGVSFDPLFANTLVAFK